MRDYCLVRFLKCATFFVAFFSIAVPLGQAQANIIGNDVIRPIPGSGHEYIQLLNETVNPANGTVGLAINFPTPKGRGISIPLALYYNSGSTQHMISYVPGNAQFESEVGSWNDSVPRATASFWSRLIVIPTNTATCSYAGSYIFYDPNGGSHSLGLTATSYVDQGNGGNIDNQYCGEISNSSQFTGGDPAYRANALIHCDGYHYSGQPDYQACSDLSIPFTVTSNDGTVYSFLQNAGIAPNPGSPATTDYLRVTSIEDRNGNIITPNYQASGVSFTDTLGRTLLEQTYSNPAVYSAGGLSYSVQYNDVTTAYTADSEQVNLPQLPQPVSCYANFTLPSEAQGGLRANNGVSRAVTSISLPNGKQYQFQYQNQFGLISRIDYPDGGWVEYTWKQNDTMSDLAVFDGDFGGGDPASQACFYRYKTPVLATRKVGFSSSPNPVQTQQFTYSTTWNSSIPYWWDSKQTIVETTDNVTGKTSKTVYTYAGIPVPGVTSYEQLAVETSVQSYDWGEQSLLQTVNKTWYDPYRMYSEQTVSNGQSTKSIYCYAGTSIAEKDVYDYVQTAPAVTQWTTGSVPEDYTCAHSATNPHGSPTRVSVTNFTGFTSTHAAPSPNPSQIISYVGNFLVPCRTNVYDASGASASQSDYYYDNQTTLCDYNPGGGTTAQVSGLPPGTHNDTNFGPSSQNPDGSANPRGNMTKRVDWISSTQSITTTYSYDETGQVISITDPCGNTSCAYGTGTIHTTTYSYVDSFSDNHPSVNTNAYLTQVTRPALNGVAHLTGYSYRYADGQLNSVTDENSETTTYQYDAVNRLHEVDGPPDVEYYNQQSVTTYDYDDQNAKVTTTTLAAPNPSMVSTSYRDGMGRIVKAQQSNPDGDICIATTYDGLGRPRTVSNPFTCGASTSDLTTYDYDALGRPTKQAKPGGDATTQSYTGNVTTISDEAGVQWQQTTDALGRLTQVVELGTAGTPLNLATNYTYDALNNLTFVNQYGGASETARTRGFNYDWLSRLTSSSNPETGAVSYSYLSAGQPCSPDVSSLCSRTDARNILTYYQYDGLGRLTRKDYSDGTPSAEYFYDIPRPADLGWLPACHTSWLSKCNLIGRLSYAQTDITGKDSDFVLTYNSYSYDVAGRLWLNMQQTSPYCNACFSTLYRYDQAGRTWQLRRGTYGAGTGSDLFVGDNIYNYNSAGRVATIFERNHGDQDTPITLFTANTYGPMGLVKATLGNGVELDMGYDQRGRINSIAYSKPNDNKYTLGLTYYANGNVQTAADSINGSWSYTYDSLNRLHTATSPNQAFQYDFDSFGNRTGQTVTAGSGPQSSYNFIPGNNRLDPSTGVTYDASGNVTWDGFHQYWYDAEGRLGGVGNNITYLYNAAGQRTAVLSGSTVLRQYLYDNEGRPGTVVDGTNSNLIRAGVWVGNVHIGDYMPDSSNTYILSDHLGNLRAVTDSTGAVINTQQSLPFGEQQNATGTDVDPLHFTGKERDAESGLDYFPARHYSSTMGRFMSPDPSGLYMADPENPQTLNLYSYVGNNPLRYTDPFGLSRDCGGGDDPSVVCIVTSAWDWLKAHLGGSDASSSSNNGSNNGGDQSQSAGLSPEPNYNLSPGVSSLRFPNVQAAGIAAARQAIGPTSQRDFNGGCSAGCKYEYGGRLLRSKNGQYTFTNPVTFHSTQHFWTNHVMVPFGYRNVGSYHTHPDGNPGSGMSNRDAQNAATTGLPSFMGEESSGRVWKYDPYTMSCSSDSCGAVVFDPNSSPK